MPLTLLAAAALLSLAWLHWAATPADAECFGPTDPWPSFRAAVPTAQRILVGEVVPPPIGSEESSPAIFRLRVIDVLRGPVPDGGVFDVVGLKSGLPLKVCADTVMILGPGDVVTLALDALAPDGETRINTLAYIRQARESVLTDVEKISVEELDALVDPTNLANRPNLAFLAALISATLLMLAAAAAYALRRTRA